MNTVLERDPTVKTPVVDEAAALHNAQINERYQRLLDVEAEQFAQFAEENYAAPTARASVLTPERPLERTVEQRPTVTEFVRTREDYDIFTPEVLDRTIQREEVNVQPTAQAEIAPSVAAVAPVAAVETKAEYGLSPFAKAAIACFTGVVVAMLAVIGVNSHVINQKRMRIKNLEEKRQELTEQNEELRRRIEQATSEETILEYAQSQGMVEID